MNAEETNPRRRFSITPRLVLGLIVIWVGVLFLLDSLDVLEADEFLRYWPVALIAVGLIKLLGKGSTGGHTASAFWIGAGTVLLLFNLDLVKPRIMIAILLLLAGAWIVLRTLTGPGSRSGAVDTGSTLSTFALMAGVNRKSASKQFRGGEATAIMGGCEIDLRDASIADGEAVMDVFAFWGGIEIIVPGDWTVLCTATPVMGGVEDTRKIVGSDPGKRLLVKGLAVMGGVEIKN